MKPLYSIQTIAAISGVKWRPGCRSQIASFSLSHDNSIHIWDLHRPFIPFITLNEHENVPTCLIWNDSESIWSCSKDETFIQQNISNGYRPRDLIHKGVVAWSSTGKMAFAMGDFKDPHSNVALPDSYNTDVDSINNPETFQTMDILDSFTFEPQKFAYLAHYYKFDPKDILSTCAANKKVFI
jgi:WD40 repeat protein